MKTAVTSPKLSTALIEDQERLETSRAESDELAATKAELEQVRAQLYGVLEGARAAFSAEDGVARALAEAEQIDEAADSVLDILCESFEFDTATLWLLDPEDGKLCAVAHRASPTSRARFLEARIRSTQLALDEGIAGRVFVERKVFLSDDAPSASDKEIGMLLADDELRTGCAFLVPRSGDRVGSPLDRRSHRRLHRIQPASLALLLARLRDQSQRPQGLRAGGERNPAQARRLVAPRT
jgi:hypothetical protein